MPTMELDLNALRERILSNQREALDLPQGSRQVLVDREGRIALADPETPVKERELSVVHQGVFAAPLH